MKTLLRLVTLIFARVMLVLLMVLLAFPFYILAAVPAAVFPEEYPVLWVLGGIASVMALIGLTAKPWHRWRWTFANNVTRNSLNDVLSMVYEDAVIKRVRQGKLSPNFVSYALGGGVAYALYEAAKDWPAAEQQGLFSTWSSLRESSGQASAPTGSDADDDWEPFSSGACVNPATGLPMTSGESWGVDVGGNPFGVDNSSSHFDSGSGWSSTPDFGSSSSWDSGASSWDSGASDGFDSSSSWSSNGSGFD